MLIRCVRGPADGRYVDVPTDIEIINVRVKDKHGKDVYGIYWPVYDKETISVVYVYDRFLETDNGAWYTKIVVDVQTTSTASR